MVNYQQVRQDDESVNPNIILRVDDTSWIPADPENFDWQEYLAWLADGNTPLAPATPSPITKTLHQRAEALALLDAAEGDSKAARALLLAIIDEINALRHRFNDLQDDVQASNNLMQLKPKWALRPAFSDRTGALVKTVMTDKITTGAAD